MKLIVVMLILASLSCRDNNDIVVESAPGIPQSPVVIPPPINPPSRPNVIDLDILEDQLILDANTLSDNERINSRWLIACNLYNEGDKDQIGIEDGINIGINSISPENSLERISPVGVGRCAYRIDLESYGITTQEWKAIEQRVLLNFVTQSLRGRQLQFLTQSLKPYLFASDFFTTTMQADTLTSNNGLYYNLVEQPFGLADFFASLGVDPQDEFDDEEAVLAGFSQSPIALQKSRQIQVLESDDGFVVTTYDSALSQPQSHFVTPFPKEAALAGGVVRTNKVFPFAAQEHIYTLPNGMLGYRLNGGAGDAETLAPNDVVVNLNATAQGLDPTIYIGSCSQCHNVANPMLQFTDQLRRHILSQSAFNADEKDLAQVFFNASRIEGRTRSVTSDYQNSLRRLGINPNNQDPLGQKLIAPFRKEMNAAQIAGYLLMPIDLFLSKLAGSNISSQIFGSLLNGGTVSLGDLSNNFEQLVIDVGAYKDDGI